MGAVAVQIFVAGNDGEAAPCALCGKFGFKHTPGWGGGIIYFSFAESLISETHSSWKESEKKIFQRYLRAPSNG